MIYDGPNKSNSSPKLICRPNKQRYYSKLYKMYLNYVLALYFIYFVKEFDLVATNKK